MLPGGFNSLLIIQQTVELAGADVLDQLLAFLDFLFEGFQTGALVRVRFVGELLHVTQQRARAANRSGLSGRLKGCPGTPARGRRSR